LAILAFDTATRATVVGLQRAAGDEVLEARDDPAPGERPRHTACLLPLVSDVLARASTSWGELERIAVGVGPGSFTGLRIGISTARALAQVLAIPLVAVPTLESLALAVVHRNPAGGPDAVVSVLDARRGEVFAAAWSIVDGRLSPLVGVAALDPRELAQRLVATEGLTPARTAAVGDGAVAFRSVLEPSGVAVPDDDAQCHRVTAVGHCRLGWSLPARRPSDVHPCYVRAPDAVPRPLPPTP
jgi:tRNA threonylcarbamoyladenosine biosynthesis protein TsaB